MKKSLLFILLFVIQVFSQSRFAIEADGGIDMVSATELSTSNMENGYSFSLSPVYYFNKTLSLFGVFAFHRMEGAVSSGGPVLDEAGYSIDNPNKPNDYSYEIAIGLRANFSNKPVKPYFVVRTGFLFSNTAFSPIYYGMGPDMYSAGWNRKHRIAFYISPGLGVNFSLLKNLNFLIEARFNITTGMDYSFIPVITGFQYRL